MSQNRLKKFFTLSTDKDPKIPENGAQEKKDHKKIMKLSAKSTKNLETMNSNEITNKKNETRILELETIIRMKDFEIDRLKKELEKLRSVLKGPIHAENYRYQNCPENSDAVSNSTDEKITKFPKDNATSKKILEILSHNIYMANIGKEQLADIVSAMFLKTFQKDDIILKEGEMAECLFLVEEGEMELSKGGEIIGTLGPGKAFGEHSFLYGCTRSTDVKAITPGKLWVLTKPTFENIMLNNMLSRQKAYLDLLNKVPLFNAIPDYNLCKVIDVMREVKYNPSHNIYTQGNKGETLYIIKQGSVEFHKKQTGIGDPFCARVLTQGSFFGEKSLLGDEYYQYDACAGPKGCVLLQIERDDFSTFIGSISGLRSDYKTDEPKLQIPGPSSSSVDYQLTNISGSTVTNNYNLTYNPTFKTDLMKRLALVDLTSITTLDVDAFSRTELMSPQNDTRIVYALRQMKKKNIVALGLQNNVLNAKRLLLEINSNFIIKLFKTFRDRKYVYFLLEACLGGTLQRLIRENRCLNEDASRFYIGCVVEALKYLHGLNIVYRDLKPSNVLIDDKGYCKLTNFIYSKKLQHGRKTSSFCGTPEYVAPELILNKGHDFAVDYWGLGVLMYETLVGTSPFLGDDIVKTYNIILKGFEGVGFPHEVGRNAQALIRKLCRIVPNERIGYAKKSFSEIQKNKWFENFNWLHLRNMVMDPPIIPNIQDGTEGYDYEDEFPRDDEIPADETSGWDKEF